MAHRAPEPWAKAFGKEETMESLKDASHFYEVERRQHHAERPGFRINELQISPTQEVPCHYHANIGELEAG